MVFTLEDIAKIESDRGIDPGVDAHKIGDTLVKKFIFEHDSLPVKLVPPLDTPAHKHIYSILEYYDDNSTDLEWSKSFHGITTALMHAFENAAVWGNRNVKGKEIVTTLKFGPRGGVTYVQDEGEGFDFKNAIAKVQESPVDHKLVDCKGIEFFNRYNCHVAYHGNGNLISIATPMSWKSQRYFLPDIDKNSALASKRFSSTLDELFGPVATESEEPGSQYKKHTHFYIKNERVRIEYRAARYETKGPDVEVVDYVLYGEMKNLNIVEEKLFQLEKPRFVWPSNSYNFD